jgi:dolichol-phosphate mannosyltransferase
LPQRQSELPHAQSGRVAELSIVVPTFKESGNIAELVQRLDAVLEGVDWEVIFVDDNSPDGTTEVVKAIAAADPRVRCLRRVRRRGLAGACIEGMLSSSAPYVGVMDADSARRNRCRACRDAWKGDTDLGKSRYFEEDAKVFSKSRGAMAKRQDRSPVC